MAFVSFCSKSLLIQGVVANSAAVLVICNCGSYAALVLEILTWKLEQDPCRLSEVN